MRVQFVARNHARQTIALMEELHVSLFGTGSRRLYTTLVTDGTRRIIDCRIATESGEVIGVVLAAPASYWRRTLLTHWALAFECVRARIARREPAASPSGNEVRSDVVALMESGTPPVTWNNPADAWRIIFIGTAPHARGRGVAGELYRSMMANRSLVARIALHNTPSIRLHHSLGWHVYRDGDVALAVHLRDRQAIPTQQEPAPAARRASGQ
jgi:ribosomal protein S18 acetylase RimI-like enzyme